MVRGARGTARRAAGPSRELPADRGCRGGGRRGPPRTRERGTAARNPGSRVHRDGASSELHPVQHGGDVVFVPGLDV